jgi:hypothetical protein
MERRPPRPSRRNRVQRTFTVKSVNKGPFRRFDRFFGETEPFGDEQDLYLNAMLSKLKIFALQISRIENRIAEYETRVNDELRVKYHLQDPVPRRKVLIQHRYQK